MLKAFLYFIYFAPLVLLLWSARLMPLIAVPFALVGSVAFCLWRIKARRKYESQPQAIEDPLGVAIRIIHER